MWLIKPMWCDQWQAPRCQFGACFLAVADEGWDSRRFGEFHRLVLLVLHLGQDLLLHERLAKPLDTTQPGQGRDVSSVLTVLTAKWDTNENENISSQWRKRGWTINSKNQDEVKINRDLQMKLAKYTLTQDFFNAVVFQERVLWCPFRSWIPRSKKKLWKNFRLQKKATDVFVCFFFCFPVSDFYLWYIFDMFQVESSCEGSPAAAHRVRTLQLRANEHRRRLMRWSWGIWCDMAKVSGTRTGCKVYSIHGNELSSYRKNSTRGKDSDMINDRAWIWQNCTEICRSLWHDKIHYFQRSMALKGPGQIGHPRNGAHHGPFLIFQRSRAGAVTLTDLLRWLSAQKPVEAETLGRLMQAELNKVRDPRWVRCIFESKSCVNSPEQMTKFWLWLWSCCVFVKESVVFLLGFSFSWEISNSLHIPQTGLTVGFASSKRRCVHIGSRKSVSLGLGLGPQRRQRRCERTMWTALWLIFAS